jgi:YD repeat-containing protein
MKNTFIGLALVSLSLTACQENLEPAIPIDPPVEEPHEPSPSDAWRLKTSVSSEGDTSFYKYDHLWRLVESTFTDGSRATYVYDADHITHNIYILNSDIIDYSFTYKLNADGLIEEQTKSNNPSYKANFFYNADHQVIKEVYTNNGKHYLRDYFYTDGNLDSVSYHLDGNWTYTYIHDQYDDILNCLSHKQFGREHSGKESKYLFKSWTSRSPSPIENTVYSTYSFDALGRVIAKTNYFNEVPSTYTYTYY